MRIEIPKELPLLWEKYDKEMDKYEVRHRSKGECMRTLAEYIASDLYLIPVYVKELADKMIGFLIVGEGKECHPDCDYYIADCFMDEEYRNAGIMGDAVKEYIKRNPGRYCLDVYKDNVLAKKFWNRVFRESGYERTVFPYVEHGVNREKMDEFYFKKG